MAWTTPKNFTTTEVVNAAADLNVYQRDNLAYLGDVPACSAYRDDGAGSTLSITAATWTTITLNKEYFDTDAMHSLVSNTSRITVPETAVYFVAAKLAWDVRSDGYAALCGVWLNGTDEIGTTWSTRDSNDPDLFLNQSVGLVRELAANDYVELRVWQQQGGTARSLATGVYPPTLSVVRLRDG